MVDVDKEKARSIVKSISIPPQPTALTETMKIVNGKNPDLSRIADVISKDVALSATVFKTINSPFFGLRREISSIQQATMLLGMTNVINIVTGLSLRMSIENKQKGEQNLGRFWDTASDTALVCANLAKAMGSDVKDDAYLFGLFHDCGIPLMQQKFPNYFEVLKIANNDAEREFTAIEEEHYNTNHATVGYMVAHSWKLPKHICEAILEHHSMDIIKESGLAPTLIAMLHMAEHISHSKRRLSDDFRWERVKEDVLQNLMIDEQEYLELKDDVSYMLE